MAADGRRVHPAGAPAGRPAAGVFGARSFLSQPGILALIDTGRPAGATWVPFGGPLGVNIVRKNEQR